MSVVNSKQIDSQTIEKIKHTIGHIITERPNNALNLFDEYLSRSQQKLCLTRPFRRNVHPDSYYTKEDSSMDIEIDIMKMFAKKDEEETSNDQEDEFEIPVPNLQYLNFYFEKAGTGLGCEETFRIMLSLKQLALEYPISVVRFWGKILGLRANYIIAEVEFREGEGADFEEDEKDKLRDLYEEEMEDYDEEDGASPNEEDRLPRSTWRPPLDIPVEEHQHGANKKSYFVMNNPGEVWVRLPFVTPAQVVVSRSIKKLFSGKLDHEVKSSPPFPGNEANYLRAVIARISASTQVSPVGYFIFPDGGEEMEDSEVQREFLINSEFAGLSVKKLVNPSLSNWVHHSEYLLPQGTCTWFDVNQASDNNDFEDVDEEFQEDNLRQQTPEVGPQLLTDLSQDQGIGSTPAWSAFVSSKLLQNSSVAILRSNIWPGAITVGKGKTFENLYIGWGCKYTFSHYSPKCPSVCFDEFLQGDDMIEYEEPSVEMERDHHERIVNVKEDEEDQHSTETDEED